MSKYFEIDGYNRDDKSEFSGLVVKEFDDFDEEKDEDVFWFGLNEENIIQIIADRDGEDANPAIDFVITSYKEINL